MALVSVEGGANNMHSLSWGNKWKKPDDIDMCMDKIMGMDDLSICQNTVFGFLNKFELRAELACV